MQNRGKQNKNKKKEIKRQNPPADNPPIRKNSDGPITPSVDKAVSVIKDIPKEEPKIEESKNEVKKELKPETPKVKEEPKVEEIKKEIKKEFKKEAKKETKGESDNEEMDSRTVGEVKKLERKVSENEPSDQPVIVDDLLEAKAAEMAKRKDFYEVRVAVVGNVDSGKSTLIGVLTGGAMDDGRGYARQKVVIHRHEATSGRTSCISQHIVGFDAKRRAVYQPIPATASAVAKDKAWRNVVANSTSLLTFIDLAGHEKYLKTTIAGLTGCFPDYALVIINSLAGITKMTKEHLGVILALAIPFAVIVTKVDMCPENVFLRTKRQLWRALKSQAVNKMPINVKTDKDVKTCHDAPAERLCPVFFYSSVSGEGLDLLMHYLGGLKPRREWETKEDQAEFNIDHTFNVPGVGVVVSGTLARGTVHTNSNLLLGPTRDGSFKLVFVRSIHTNRVPVESCRAGVSCCLAIRSVKRKEPLKRNHIRRGMVLVAPDQKPVAYRAFSAEVLILHHASTIGVKYQAVIHCGIVRQSAAIEGINKEFLRTGDKAIVKFRFMSRAEFVRAGQTFIFREGSTKGVGRIVDCHDSVQPPAASKKPV